MGTIDRKEQSKVRTKYLDSVIAKILGLGSEPLFNGDFEEEFAHEIISESPKNRYITGMLFPRGENQRAGLVLMFNDSFIDYFRNESECSL